jgi:GntR family transcriptional regulator/MocR family aminotransferase
LLLETDDPVWIEDPGYLGARAALRASGVRLIPVPIDSEGLSQAHQATERPRLIYCTPSRQFPLGTTMTISRRLALLEFAREHDVWIVEDDYDSEFRYVDRPLPSLQGLNDEGHVIYTGSFSKVLFPSLRLGYLVLPEALIEVFRKAKEIGDAASPTIDQATVAVFIEEGFFSTHVRRMRRVYRERLDAFLNEASKCLHGWLRFPSVEAGMDAVGWLEQGTDDSQISKQLMAAGVVVPPLSAYSIGTCAPGLVFGFTAFSPAQIRTAMRVIATIIQKAG